MRAMRSRLLVAASIIVVSAGAVGGAAFAVGLIPGVDGVIHACYSVRDGNLRVVDGTEPCGNREEAISWNQVGPQGASSSPFSFAFDTVDTVVGHTVSVAVGPNGLGLLSYVAEANFFDNGGLVVVACGNNACSSVPIRRNSLTPQGRSPSIVVGRDGVGLVAYDSGNLNVAHCVDVDCTAATVSTLDDVGDTPSMALGADGLGLIAYVDPNPFGTGALKVAHCADTACTSAQITTLDSGDWRNPSVAVGTDGLGLISYNDPNSLDLKVAHCENAACSSATVTVIAVNDALGGAIGIGADGLGFVAYEAPAGLKVAHCNDAACTASDQSLLDDSTAGGARAQSIAVGVGRDGLNLISYYTFASPRDNLHLAHCNDSACTTAGIEVLDRAGDVGIAPSMAVREDGRVLIAYLHALGVDSELRIAHSQ